MPKNRFSTTTGDAADGVVAEPILADYAMELEMVSGFWLFDIVEGNQMGLSLCLAHRADNKDSD